MEPTSTILCATRGGEASYPAQDRAIEIAKKRNAKLVYLYVADVKFLSHFSSPIIVDVDKEMEEMGEFLLLMAKERAAKAGVEAETVVKHGVFREALISTARETDASVIVLGEPRRETSILHQDILEQLVEDVTEDIGISRQTFVEQLAQEVQEATGIETLVVYSELAEPD